MGRDREGKSKREKARESLENLLFCWRPEKCFPNFSKLGTEIYKPSCTAHIPQVQSPVQLTPAIFFFLQIKVCALLHSKELLASGPQGHACKEREQTHVAEGYTTLSEERWSTLRTNEQRGIQRGSSKMIQENSPIPVYC